MITDFTLLTGYVLNESCNLTFFIEKWLPDIYFFIDDISKLSNPLHIRKFPKHSAKSLTFSSLILSGKSFK